MVSWSRCSLEYTNLSDAIDLEDINVKVDGTV